nr:MAG TPA: hypothetical protein [Inoviridae sp.]DAR56849.1 MAG TPA: hypothetical protein [Caudoviricetes sp.]
MSLFNLYYEIPINTIIIFTTNKLQTFIYKAESADKH